MILSEKIEYSPSESYKMNNGAYIVYYKGNEFIQTILHSSLEDNANILLETVEEADTIRISFHESFLNNFEIYKE